MFSIPAFLLCFLALLSPAFADEMKAALKAKDYSSAARIYRERAEKGDAEALDQLGLLYEEGRGVKKDCGEAMRLFVRASSASANAVFNMGRLHLRGCGVKADAAEALRLFNRAAVAGDGAAAFALGVAYREGAGVGRDAGLSWEWLKRSAGAGFAAGENEAGMAFEFGRDVKKDLPEALKWYMLAAMQGNEEAAGNWENLEASISSKDASEGRKRAADFSRKAGH